MGHPVRGSCPFRREGAKLVGGVEGNSKGRSGSPVRTDLLSKIAGEILALTGVPVRRVGVDGVDGAGKSRFADELAAVLAARHASVIRASIDSFHNPRAVRYRRGRHSGEGYFLDSFDLDALRARLLDPLSPGGSGRYRRAVFDHRSDAPVVETMQTAGEGAILVFDGVFIHRPELTPYWDYSIFLDVPFEESIRRCADRDGGSGDLDAPGNTRYVRGQKIYLERCDPLSAATVVIDNSDLSAPFVKSGTDT